jgi:hypothetical protein
MVLVVGAVCMAIWGVWDAEPPALADDEAAASAVLARYSELAEALSGVGAGEGEGEGEGDGEGGVAGAVWAALRHTAVEVARPAHGLRRVASRGLGLPLGGDDDDDDGDDDDDDDGPLAWAGEAAAALYTTDVVAYGCGSAGMLMFCQQPMPSQCHIVGWLLTSRACLPLGVALQSSWAISRRG